ncbi:unnamed protein product [Gordionus sp. m RMFG-2023]
MLNKGIENIYTQHKTLIEELLDQILKIKLKENLYPYFGSIKNEKFSDIVIYIVGGLTYEEILATYMFNKNNNSGPQAMQVLIGGTNILNSQMFLDTLDQFSHSSSGI